MRDIAAIEVSVLVDELRDTFATAYYKNFYELEENRFLLTISKERKEHAINIRLLKTINETEYKETAERASEFALTVRKKLDGCRVESIEQHAADRIVIISFSGKNELRLILEMLDKGNLLLVNKEGVIEVVYTSRSYRDRNIRRGAVYVFPKSEALKLKEIGQEDAAAISEKLKCSEQKLIVAISKHVNAGPLYLENAINNAGLDANKPASAQELGGDEVAHMINELQESLRKPEPRIYIREGEPLDFAITAIAKYESNTELKTETFESLNKLLDALYLKERSTSIDTG
ncbi:hypothetical protein D4S03_08450 [bacterium]|nr:MAG: hypothetical protein D4S03_08450 [bacterium]